MPDLKSRQPLIFALIAAVAMVAAILAYVLTPDDEATADAKTFTSDESAAIGAAQTEVANLSSYRRAHFEADFQRTLNGATGSIVADIKRNKASLQKTVTDCKCDLIAKVTHAALVGPVDNEKVTGYQLLISFNGYRSSDQNSPNPGNVRVTVVKQKNKWLLSELTSIAIT